ncbi:MAG: hypothetical protein QOE11_2819, partial [Solirubrobacteraceae bacterium]|nr:hypothetical protein [Solirubrobacteraceae bacterium]
MTLFSSWRYYLRWAAATAVVFGVVQPLIENGHLTAALWVASAIGFFLTAMALGLVVACLR